MLDGSYKNSPQLVLNAVFKVGYQEFLERASTPWSHDTKNEVEYTFIKKLKRELNK